MEYIDTATNVKESDQLKDSIEKELKVKDPRPSLATAAINNSTFCPQHNFRTPCPKCVLDQEELELE